MRRLGTGRRFGGTVLAAAATLCAVAVPGQAAADGGSGRYSFESGAKPIEGAVSSSDAEPIEAGSTYRDSLGATGSGTRRYYRLDLDTTTNVYVSATAVPGPDTKVAYGDGIKVSVQDGDGSDCSSGDAHFGSTESPRPIAAWAARMIQPGSGSCQTAGTYYAVVERTSEPGSTPDDWDLELRYVSEQGLKRTGPTTAPENWSSASPQPPAGERRERSGGSGFGAARGLEEGIWQDSITPGQTRFYRVPVDWGEQISVGAELGSSSGGDSGYVASALVVSLYNPVRGFIADTVAAYDGKQRSAAFEPLAPVAYENRYSVDNRVSAMRFAGWYYLVVNLSPAVAREVGDGPFGVTLSVTVRGKAQAAPEYAGPPEPAGEFTVTHRDKEAAARGAAPAGVRDGSVTMRLVALGAFALGTLLVLLLAVWTLVARRRAGAVAPGGGAGAAGVAGHDGIAEYTGGAGHVGEDLGSGTYGQYAGTGGTGGTGAAERDTGHGGTSGQYRSPGAW